MHSPQAKCGLCKAPLVLFADFDATDQQLRGDHGLSRLPLLYCCSCPGPVHYLVSNSGDVTTIPSEEQYIGDLLGDDFIDEECPFTDRPKVIPKGYLTLIEISAELDRLIVPALTTEGFAALTPSDKQKLAALLGREPVGRWEMYFSQIGGYPNSYQGDEGKPDVCPNPECPLRLKRGQEFQYRPLAVLDLWDDEFWGLDKDALQIVYHICPGCMCISAQYTCT
jgi:hypothetical protein